jgi:phosphoglycerate dehydrogenase-like enzyme
MKSSAYLINVARAEIVDEEHSMSHLQTVVWRALRSMSGTGIRRALET